MALKKVLSILGLSLTCSLAGLALGVLYVRLFIPAPAMGWDAIADMLGGMMAGALLGLLTGAVLYRQLPQGQRIRAGLIATGVALVTFAGLIITAPKSTSTPPPTITRAFQPAFRLTIRVSHTEEILSRTPPNAQPLPFTEAQISSGKPVLLYKTWGPAFATCTTQPDSTDLALLVSHIEALEAAVGPLCQTPEDDLLLAASWRLAGTQGNQSIHAGCLDAQPAFLAATQAIEQMASRLCSTADDNGVTP